MGLLNWIGPEAARARGALGAPGHERAGGGDVVPLPAGKFARALKALIADNWWPADLNAVPARRLEAEARAAELGITLVSYRTKGQFLEAIEGCLANLEPDEDDEVCAAPICDDPSRRVAAAREDAGAVVAQPISQPPVTLDETFAGLPAGPFVTPRPPKLIALKGGAGETRPEVEAKAFLAWLIRSNLIGHWSSEEMSDFYARFCRDTSRTPIPENVLRAALKVLDGASKDEAKVRAGGKLIRTVVWIIEGTAPMKERKPNAARAA